MSTLDELIEKRKVEINVDEKAQREKKAAEEKAKREDERNYNASVGYGILGALGGLVGGFVFYIIVGIIAAIVMWSSKPFSEVAAWMLLIISLLIGGIIGFLYVFNGIRKKSD